MILLNINNFVVTKYVEWEKLRFVLRGKVRKNVLLSFDSPKTATKIADELQTHRSTVSRVLSALEKEGFVVCLDPEEPYNRYYKRTGQGDEAAQEIEDMH